MKLKDILQDIPYKACTCDLNAEITFLTHDSRQAAPGGLFVALKGADSGIHGMTYAADAVAKGGSGVLCDKPCDPAIPHVQVENAEEAFSLAAANLYGRPAEKLKLIGVTGTNGKTTVTHLVRDILASRGEVCGLIGTNEICIGTETRESHATTPEPPELQALFAEMVKKGCGYCIMEISSHALALGRVAGLTFAVGAFTNLTQDHLNFHKTMDAYAKAKATLFSASRVAVINQDDGYAPVMMRKVKGRLLRFSTKRNDTELVAKNIRLLSAAVSFEALVGDEIQRIHLGIPGAFSVENALAAMGICSGLGLTLSEIATGLAAAGGVCGRAEVLPLDTPYTVMIDYAHSPDSLENILHTVRAVTRGRLLVVFGCGGDRDRGKRPIMGSIAEKIADMCYVTSDNPRTEEPMSIIEEILAGMSRENHVAIENRRQAIGRALDDAQPGDFVLIAGKGHETYQDINHVKYHFDEREVVREHLNGASAMEQ